MSESDLFRNSEFPAEGTPKSESAPKSDALFDTLPPKPTEPNATIRAPASPAQLAELVPKLRHVLLAGVIDETNDRDALLGRLRARAKSLTPENVEAILRASEQ